MEIPFWVFLVYVIVQMKWNTQRSKIALCGPLQRKIFHSVETKCKENRSPLPALSPTSPLPFSCSRLKEIGGINDNPILRRRCRWWSTASAESTPMNPMPPALACDPSLEAVRLDGQRGDPGLWCYHIGGGIEGDGGARMSPLHTTSKSKLQKQRSRERENQKNDSKLNSYFSPSNSLSPLMPSLNCDQWWSSCNDFHSNPWKNSDGICKRRDLFFPVIWMRKC